MKATNSPNEVEAVRTPINLVELGRSFTWRYSAAGAEVALAQIIFEVGQGKQAWNNNIGNVKCSDSVPHMYLDQVSEFINGKKEVFSPPSTQCRFRAYASLSEATDAWSDLIAADWAQAAAELSNQADSREVIAAKYCQLLAHPTEGRRYGYFTDPVADYTAKVLCELPIARAIQTIGSMGFSSVQECQTAYGLTADGVVGPKTIAALLEPAPLRAVQSLDAP